MSIFPKITSLAIAGGILVCLGLKSVSANELEFELQQAYGEFEAVSTLSLKEKVAGAPQLTEANGDLTEILMREAKQGLDSEIMRTVINSGLDVNTQDTLCNMEHCGMTALMWAARMNKYPEIISVLIDAGADIEGREIFSRRTPLMLAASYNTNPEVIRTLIASGADVNAEARLNKYDNPAIYMTAAMWAARSNPNPEILKVFIELGATQQNINELLILAASWNTNPDIIDFLVESGADLKHKDAAGLSVSYYARKFNENTSVLTRIILLMKKSQEH